MSGQNQIDRISTPDFIAGLNLDQLHRCVELANARIQKLKEGDKVEVFVVGDFCNYFATTSRKEALLWIVEAASYCATEDLPCDELSMQSHFMWPSEAEDYLKSLDSKPSYFIKLMREHKARK